MIDELREACVRGEDITLRGFGMFRVVTQAPKKGRNIGTGQMIDLPARKKVRFELSSKVVDEVAKLPLETPAT